MTEVNRISNHQVLKIANEIASDKLWIKRFGDFIPAAVSNEKDFLTKFHINRGILSSRNSWLSNLSDGLRGSRRIYTNRYNAPWYGGMKFYVDKKLIYSLNDNVLVAVNGYISPNNNIRMILINELFYYSKVREVRQLVNRIISDNVRENGPFISIVSNSIMLQIQAPLDPVNQLLDMNKLHSYIWTRL